MTAKRLLPRRRMGRRNPRRATILDHHELGAMFGVDGVDEIAAELRRRGVRYHVGSGVTYTNAALAKQLGHTLAVFYSTYAGWIDTDSDRSKVELAFGRPESGAKVAH